ncbi:hypothetical protein B0T26DRAFT_333970 [Lasiosphaeria miniovina]|uniref:Uncharacterized protein n=1 Tax=Lasiosphaeria miniovina TaxID=1954250 RepID=A0AA40AMJ4_9PEZI|nr:uncharacterized protein B0T26DRAFT_333970 [Lasiosphaeria miniovina]KAK0718607.1 hypothetical protein B0T26DRAFT_333970 [Lasiosphaeria miniovina]
MLREARRQPHPPIQASHVESILKPNTVRSRSCLTTKYTLQSCPSHRITSCPAPRFAHHDDSGPALQLPKPHRSRGCRGAAGYQAVPQLLVYSSGSHLTAVVGIVLANYAFGVVFWAFLYSRFLSPLCYILGPKAFISAAYRAIVVKEGPSGDIFLKLAKQYFD